MCGESGAMGCTLMACPPGKITYSSNRAQHCLPRVKCRINSDWGSHKAEFRETYISNYNVQ